VSGQSISLALGPAGQKERAIDAAWPMQKVATSAGTYCMVSYDGHAQAVHHATRENSVEHDVFVGDLRSEEGQLGDHMLGGPIVDRVWPRKMMRSR